MSKYKIEMSFFSDIMGTEYDNLSKDINNIFFSWAAKYYNSKASAKAAITNIVGDLTKHLCASVPFILDLRLNKLSDSLSCEAWGFVGDAKCKIGDILLYIDEIPQTKIAIVLTKSIFDGNNDYLFSETIGKADSQKQAETLRDIDKQKFGDSYERNGWKVHYFFNKVEV